VPHLVFPPIYAYSTKVIIPSNQNFVWTFLSRVCYMSHSFHSPLFNCLTVRQRSETIKLLIIWFSSFSRYLPLPDSNIHFSTFFSFMLIRKLHFEYVLWTGRIRKYCIRQWVSTATTRKRHTNKKMQAYPMNISMDNVVHFWILNNHSLQV